VRLTLLGTSSAIPARERGLQAVALRLDDGRVWLVDCGEGTQHRLLATDLRPSRLERVLLTHLHGDHCFGLPGLLATLGMLGRSAPLALAAPTGVRSWLDATLRTAALRLPYPLEVTELEAPGPVAGGDPSIEAVGLVHRVPSYAYVIREAPRRGHLDVARARRAGVQEGPLLGALAAGRAVVLPDGHTVASEDVLGPARPGRVVVVCGDSLDSRALIDAAPDCDVLVHECTYDASRDAQAREWMHSTTAMVADLARAVRPRLLVLTHFSTRYAAADAPIRIDDLRREVEERCPGQAVVAARDGLEVDVPAREAGA
jgi:ribonuclease Z